jgi:hypothetical protein
VRFFTQANQVAYYYDKALCEQHRLVPRQRGRSGERGGGSDACERPRAQRKKCRALSLHMGLTVRGKVRRSRTHGRGLVADQDIARGEVVWRFDPRVDRVVRDLTTAPERYWRFRHFAYYDKALREWVYSTDKSKWMNHASRPNTAIRSDGSLVARRRIRRGGEITTNYCHESGLCRGDAEWPTVDRATTPPLRPPPRRAFRRAPPSREHVRARADAKACEGEGGDGNRLA